MIIGFCVGNAILTYVANGNTVPIITIREILISSLGLILIPKSVNINIEDVIPNIKYLPASGGRIEEAKEDTICKLNSVSETISDIAKSYNQSAQNTIQNESNLEEESKKYFSEEILDNFESLEDNLLYDDLINADITIFNQIYDVLREKDDFTNEDFIKIFNKNSSTILETNLEDEREKELLEKDINSIVKIINSTYRINNLNLIWKQREAANKRVLANQLGGVSKVISTLADEIEEEKENETTTTKDIPSEKFELKISQAKLTKENSEISGDNSAAVKLKNAKRMIALSDGMGSGSKANNSSKTVIRMLKRLLTTGFEKDISIELINSAVNLNSNDETYATIDMLIFDPETANAEFIKNGACPTFIKSKNNVEVVKAISFPAGILDNIELVVYDKDLCEGDILIMCTDGILDSNTEYENKELWLKELIENLDTDDTKKIANIILQEAVDNGYGVVKDDMTVIVIKVQKKNKM